MLRFFAIILVLLLSGTQASSADPACERGKVGSGNLGDLKTACEQMSADLSLGPNAHVLPNCTPDALPRMYAKFDDGKNDTEWQPGPNGAVQDELTAS